MTIESILLLTAMIFIAATLYSSVGHAGASGYLAAMALFSMAPLEMRPTALVLNILVAIIATSKYLRAGYFSWPLFWPLALASIPFAYVGGTLNLPTIYYKPLVGLILIYAAWHFLRDASKAEYEVKQPRLPLVLVSGTGLGFLAGLTGVGGGIFLSPLLIVLHWAEVKHVSGVASAFILLNSIAGLLGFLTSETPRLPEGLAYWAIAAVVGGYIGAEYGSKRFGNPMIKRLLSLVLLIAGIKMILTS